MRGDTGRRVGLGVGLTFGLLALGGAGFLAWRWLRHKNRGEPVIINSSPEMGFAGPGTGTFGAMEPDQGLRENDAFGPMWGNDGPRRAGL